MLTRLRKQLKRHYQVLGPKRQSWVDFARLVFVINRARGLCMKQDHNDSQSLPYVELLLDGSEKLLKLQISSASHWERFKHHTTLLWVALASFLIGQSSAALLISCSETTFPPDVLSLIRRGALFLNRPLKDLGSQLGLSQPQVLIRIPDLSVAFESCKPTLLIFGFRSQEVFERFAEQGNNSYVFEYFDYFHLLNPPGTPPKEIPCRLLDRFSMNGQVQILFRYKNNTRIHTRIKRYTHEKINLAKARATRKETGQYKKTDTWLYEALDKYSIHRKKVAVMGSTSPWYEAICMNYGGNCTTIEYNPIFSECPELRVISPLEYQKNPELFDAALSISSFEHDGLGRYGDPLNPDGDLKAMDQLRSMLHPGSLVYLSIPLGKDTLVWNLHRIYGRLRLPLMLKGWRLVDTFGYEDELLDRDTGFGWDKEHPEYPAYQPIFVLQRI